MNNKYRKNEMLIKVNRKFRKKCCQILTILTLKYQICKSTSEKTAVL